MRVIAVAALALASGCGVMLPPDCYVTSTVTVGGEVPVAFCAIEETGRTEQSADIYAKRIGQVTFAFEAVLEERGMVPAGLDWRVDEIREVWADPDEEYDSIELQQMQHFAGKWDHTTGTILINAAVRDAERADAVFTRHVEPHEFMHVYDWRVLGVDSWHWAERLNGRGYHFALGDLALDILRDVKQRVLHTAWTCGDGGLEPPAKYGCDKYGWWED